MRGGDERREGRKTKGMDEGWRAEGTGEYDKSITVGELVENKKGNKTNKIQKSNIWRERLRMIEKC